MALQTSIGSRAVQYLVQTYEGSRGRNLWLAWRLGACPSFDGDFHVAMLLLWQGDRDAWTGSVQADLSHVRSQFRILEMPCPVLQGQHGGGYCRQPERQP